MPSLIPGYEYDIFISYRQKDNRYDGWVTRFVGNFTRELEATFKEDVSVYFDVNPHDGLLETHDVDASLKDKLKCLVFIPIISRTYCDPLSFAWEHEFKPFVANASLDRFGLKITLPNGNVASRVLPVRIHDLDNEDIASCESVLGSMLRGVEFIYREPGVNKPLTEEDDETRNQNNTKYRIQINKVALATREIIAGMMSGPASKSAETAKPDEGKTDLKAEDGMITTPERNLKGKKFVSRALVTVLSLLLLTFLLLEILRGPLKSLNSSNDKLAVAVFPFQNMTNDSLWDIWQGGIQDNLITALSNSSDLKVRKKETLNLLLQNEAQTNYASIAPSLSEIISQKLDIDIFITGSITREGSKTRLNAQITDPKTDEVYKSFRIDGTADSMLFAIDSLSGVVMDYLVISRMISELPQDRRFPPVTNSPEAYRLYLLGESARSRRDYATARKMFEQALSIDSTYHHMKLMIAVACMNEGLFPEARKWSDRAYEKRNQMPVGMQILINSNHAYFHETPFEEIQYLSQYIEIDDSYPGTYYDIGQKYASLLQFDKAIPEYEKALELYDKMDVKPWWVYNYIQLGYAYHQTGQYRKEKKLYARADEDFPDDPSLVWRKAIMYLTVRDTANAGKYLRQYRSIYKKNGWPESALERNLGWAYTQANMPDQAEISFRRSVSLDSKSPWWVYYLAYFLIDKERNVREGVELSDRALELSQGQYEWIFMDCKGWGYYKQGRFEEAREILEKSWALRRSMAAYDHEALLHLEAARNAAGS